MNTIHLLNGYAPTTGTGLYPDSKDNMRLLRKLGITPLTRVRPIADMDAEPETDLEKALGRAFPGGYNDSADEYFVVRRDGIQCLVLIHCGQWFAGKNEYHENDGTLVSREDTDEAEKTLLVDATVRFKNETEPCRRLFSVFAAPEEGSKLDTFTFFHCNTLDEFAGLASSVDNGEDFVILDYQIL